MSENRKIIPSSDAGFTQRFELICQVVAAKCAGPNPEWTHIPPAKVTELTNANAAWIIAYTPTLSPHSKVETTEKNRVRKESERTLRKFIQRYFYDADDVVTDTDLESMELPPHDHIWTSHGIPTEHVGLEARPNEAAEVRLDYICTETGKHAKPDDTYKGMVLYLYHLKDGEEVPPVEAFEESKLVTRSPRVEHFESALRGKRVAFSGAWENGKGEEGPRCPPVVTVIP